MGMWVGGWVGRPSLSQSQTRPIRRSQGHPKPATSPPSLPPRLDEVQWRSGLLVWLAASECQVCVCIAQPGQRALDTCRAAWAPCCVVVDGAGSGVSLQASQRLLRCRAEGETRHWGVEHQIPDAKSYCLVGNLGAKPSPG